MSTNRTCFVIMPFGEKEDASGEKLDFDKVFNHIIRPPIEAMKIECIRCDDIEKAGQIHKDMFSQIHSGDVAIVDITTLNPNVFYELGVRHSLRPAVTVLIRKKGTSLPFNIRGMRIIDYDLDVEDADKAKDKIKEFVRAGLEEGRRDSPVLDALPQVQITEVPTPLDRCELHRGSLKIDDGKRVVLLTGDIRSAKHIADVWVNPENTNMQMARFYEGSISGIIRYLGAKKSKTNRVLEDTVADELAQLMGAEDSVTPATTLYTSSGELERTHGVKRVFHVASHHGQLQSGYQPIQELGDCIREALELVDSEAMQDVEISSILFPMMGVHATDRELKDTSRQLLRAAISYMSNNPNSRVDTVFFLTSTDLELEACKQLLGEDEDIVESDLPVTGLGESEKEDE